MSKTQIVRLTSGEELIAKIEETETTVTLKKPAILIPAGKDQIAFGQWLPYADIENGIEISKEYVVFIVAPMDEMSQQYEQAFGSGLVVPQAKIETPGLKFTGAEI
tara:strand:+ start:1273 stop:1590 length:318 start_codon:yes stop_codon:yes gene_type:complete